MTVNVLETARQYCHSNGGHAAVAATIGVQTSHLVEVTAGQRRPTTALAVGLAPLLGVTVWSILSADTDAQLLARRGAAV